MINIALKPGVQLHTLRPQALFAIQVAAFAYAAIGKDFVITSVNDGKHSQKSLHYSGYAFDCRIRHLSDTERDYLLHMLKNNLRELYDVVLEPTHIHIEYDPPEDVTHERSD